MTRALRIAGAILATLVLAVARSAGTTVTSSEAWCQAITE